MGRVSGGRYLGGEAENRLTFSNCDELVRYHVFELDGEGRDKHVLRSN